MGRARHKILRISRSGVRGGFTKDQANGVDAIAETGWRRAIGEYMPEMRTAGGAAHLGTTVSEEIIGGFLHGFIADRFEITGPAAAGMKFGIGLEQRRIAADAMIHSRRFGVGIFAGVWTFGPFFHADAELFGGKPGPPIRTAFGVIGVDSGKGVHASNVIRKWDCAMKKFPAGFSSVHP